MASLAADGTRSPQLGITADHSAASVGGKFLTFFLAGEEYGIEILKVHEIIGMMAITTVPRTPKFIRGVINLRGKVIPIVDLRLKFGMESRDQTAETCIIVVNVEGLKIGIVVDQVSEVLNIDGSEIEAAPAFGANVNTDFITLQPAGSYHFTLTVRFWPRRST